MNLNQKFSVMFHLIKAKRNQNGLCPIWVRIIVDGKRAECSTGKQVLDQHWNSTKSRANSKCPDDSVNEFLNMIDLDIRKHYNILLVAGKNITADEVKRSFQGVKNKMTFLELFKLYNQHLDQRLAIQDLSHYRCAKFKMLYDRCQSYIKWKFKRNDLLLDEVKLNFLVGFEMYLRTEDGVSINTSMKAAKDLKQVTKYGVVMEYIPTNVFMTFRGTYKRTKREFLDKTELEKLGQKVISLPRLAEVRDCYLFSCYTGFAYVDAESITPQDLYIGNDGETWVARERKKTGTRENVPLLPIALSLVDKYKEHPYCVANNRILPVNSNQKYNEYLKEVAGLCGINKKLTTHTARHTFATTVLLSNGVPMETTMELLGHRDIRTTLIYGKIVQQKVSDDMKALKAKLSEQNKGTT